MSRILVLGGSSFVGRAVTARLGERAVPTFHRHPMDGGLRFDLLSQRVGGLLDACGPVSHAALLLAEPQPDRCIADPEGTHRLNVERMTLLLDDLIERGVVPIFASSEFVFDGGKGDYAEEDAASPILLYGQQKLAVERHLTGRGAPHAILRLAKVYGHELGDGTLFSNWLKPIAGPIRCAEDQSFSPVSVLDVAEAVAKVAERQLEGLFHVSCGRRFSRIELLRLTLVASGRNVAVEPCSIDDFGLPERRPRDVSMRSDKLAAAAGMVFRQPEQVVAALAAQVAA